MLKYHNSTFGKYLEKDSELTLAQRVHLAQGSIKSFLYTPLIAIGIGIIIIALIIPVTMDTRNFIDSFGFFESRLNSIDGPQCISESFQSKEEYEYPSQIRVFEGLGAEQAGIQSGDFISSINGVPISTSGDLDDWTNIPGVSPGDVVDVEVIRDGSLLSFSVTTTPRADFSSEPMLGVEIAFSCYSYFFLNEGSLSEEAVGVISENLDNILLISGGMGIILIVFSYYLIKKLIKLRSEVSDWENSYLDQNYILTFETNPPSGSTDGEKIFNMAQTVFPELRKSNEKPEKWKGVVKGIDGYEFDCFQPTNVKEDYKKEILVVKHFGDIQITPEKLQELCDAAKSSKKSGTKNTTNEMEIFRIICVGKNYEPKLLKNEKYLDGVMDDLDFDGLVDLILEKDDNYTVIRFETG